MGLIRLGGTVAVVDDHLWLGGGAVGAEDEWASDRELLVVDSSGALVDTIDLPIANARWMPGPDVTTVGGVTYIAGPSCQELPGDHSGDEGPGCLLPRPEIIRVDGTGAAALDASAVPMADDPNGITRVIVMGEHDESLVVGTAVQVGMNADRYKFSELSADGSFAEIPDSPIAMTQSFCMSDEAIVAAGFYVTDQPDLSVSTYRFDDAKWSEPMPFAVDGEPGGLVDLRCVGDDVVLIHGRSLDTVTVRPLIIAGEPVVGAPVSLPAPVSFVQPIADGLLLSVSTRPPALEVWEYRIGGSIERVASHHGPTVGGAVVQLEGSLYGVGHLGQAEIDPPLTLVKIEVL